MNGAILSYTRNKKPTRITITRSDLSISAISSQVHFDRISVQCQTSTHVILEHIVFRTILDYNCCFKIHSSTDLGQSFFVFIFYRTFCNPSNLFVNVSGRVLISYSFPRTCMGRNHSTSCGCDIIVTRGQTINNQITLSGCSSIVRFACFLNANGGSIGFQPSDSVSSQFTTTGFCISSRRNVALTIFDEVSVRRKVFPRDDLVANTSVADNSIKYTTDNG